jgi:hypothetical protein
MHRWSARSPAVEHSSDQSDEVTYWANGEVMPTVLTSTTRGQTAAFVAGYLREHLLMDAAERELARQEIVTAAGEHGLSIDAIFIECLESTPAAFASMVERLQASEGAVVIIPGAHHFAGLGDHPMSVYAALKGGGIEVILARHIES